MGVKEAIAPQVTEEHSGATTRLALSGEWSIATVAGLYAGLREMPARLKGAVTLDGSGVERIDTAGAVLLVRLESALAAAGSKPEIAGFRPEQEALIAAVRREGVPDVPAPPKENLVLAALAGVGRTVADLGTDFRFGLELLGDVIVGLGRWAISPRRIRWNAIVAQVQRTGLNAVPLMTLMSFLIGGIIAQQGAFQLRAFGAELYVVDLVGILMLREIGVLLTAIMLAGRSGSAYTAEIGSMKMREEIDALRVLGLDPVEILVTPRIVALIISLPLLTFLSDIAGLVGGAMVAWLYSGITLQSYITELHAAVWLSTFLVGIYKAPFMATIIGLVACSEGLKVQGSAESLGRQTTDSVVKSIFMVIVVDGFFAIFFAAIGF